jgi:PAS domain S-box-containing protein
MSAPTSHKLFEALPLGLAICDMEGKLTYVNPAYAEILGYTVLETLQLTYWEITPIDYELQEQEQLSSLDKTGRYGPFEKEYIHKDGHRIPVRLSGVLIRENGQDLIWSSVEDITQRKKAEEISIKGEKRLLRAEEFAHLGHWQFSIDDGILISSDEMGRIYGFDPDVHRMTLEEGVRACHPDDLERVQSAFDTTLMTGAGFEYEHRIVRRDERVRTIHAKTECELDQDGNVTSMFGVIQDITERKIIEYDLIDAKNEAETANKAKSDFLSSMSHELRTPLNAVIGFSDTMKAAVFGPLNEKYLEYAKDINSSGKHLLELVNDILDLAKLENEKVELNIEKVTPKELIGDIIPIVSNMMNEQQIEFVDRCDGHENVAVLADKTRLKQVLLNLFTNAIKYNAKRGKVILGCESTADGMTRITVADTGLGIPLGLQPDIFEAFNRLGYDDSNIKGTGIGLTISKHLLELMGGRIGFESTEGRGSNFWIMIPRAPL